MNLDKFERKPGLMVAGVAALAFGALTLVEGVGTLRLTPDQRPEGVLPLVLSFNTVAGVFYLVAGAAILLRRAWAGTLAWALAGSTVLVFVGVLIHIGQGGAYMPRTVGAMSLRSAFWIWLAWLLRRQRSRH